MEFDLTKLPDGTTIWKLGIDYFIIENSSESGDYMKAIGRTPEETFTKFIKIYENTNSLGRKSGSVQIF